jgi:hypothetical protein
MTKYGVPKIWCARVKGRPSPSQGKVVPSPPVHGYIGAPVVINIPVASQKIEMLN